MSRTLDLGLPCPPPAPEPETAHCVLLTQEQMGDVDDMASFIDAVRAEIAPQFKALGFGNTAAGELTALFIGGAE